MNRWGLVVAAVLFAAAVSTQPAHAYLCCDTSSDSITSTLTGTGSSCSAAQTALSTAIHNEEVSTCQDIDQVSAVCRFGIHYVDDCYDVSPGVFGSKGWEAFECLGNFCSF